MTRRRPKGEALSTTRLKLLLSSHGASPYGAERVLLILAEGLAARGHDVTLEIPHEGPMLDEARTLPGITIWHSRRPRLPRGLREGLAYGAGAPRALARLFRHIRRERYDLVWVNSLFNPLAAFAGRLAGRPVVWHLHERNPRGPVGVVVALVVRLGCDLPIAVSRFVARTFERGPGPRPRSRVLREPFRRLPASPPRSEADDDDADGDGDGDADAFVVGYLGQFEPRKRVSDLVAAVARVPGAHALLVGDGKKRHVVEAAVRRLGIEDRVTFAGFQREVSAWYDRMDCVVIPSRDEPCPLVAFEAMCVGRPVIASDHGGHPEVLGDAGMLYPLGDVERLADCIERLRRDAALRRDLRERSLRRAAAFSPDDWWRRVEMLIADAIGGRGHRAVSPAAGSALDTHAADTASGATEAAGSPEVHDAGVADHPDDIGEATETAHDDPREPARRPDRGR
ncbi:MAG: glycosyltransferase [Gemmatimonadota bacterium]